ncbi:hypothetical protein DOTSEDRAFT_87881 [Dothistroma septosporum NZE10]|uniref:DNA 3'-5' helicase n=1 Tax=Dothistroma septosporum (strain NZE10 / CBS 128990) TaxID=675120 RepID=N1PT74_DOTSN|nr:hypothetical protein DOTSEDRAFT_87881 [Dothistroma septosporum NZE10]
MGSCSPCGTRCIAAEVGNKCAERYMWTGEHSSAFCLELGSADGEKGLPNDAAMRIWNHSSPTACICDFHASACCRSPCCGRSAVTQLPRAQAAVEATFGIPAFTLNFPPQVIRCFSRPSHDNTDHHEPPVARVAQPAMDEDEYTATQIDALGRPCLEPVRVQPSVNSYHPHDEYAQDYQQSHDYHYVPRDGYMQAPQQLDSFDERLLRQPDYDSRHAQAALGRARLSLPSGHVSTRAPRHAQVSPTPTISQAVDLPRFALTSVYKGPSSSSPHRPRFISSPVSGASQRHPEPAWQQCHGREADDHHFGHAAGSHQSHDAFDSYRDLEPCSVPLPDEPIQQPPPKFRPNHTIDAAAARPSRGAPPVVQGINLVSARELPDRFRAIFPFPLLNAVQSKCFDVVYKTNHNLVVSAPTGSGKTAILELAICRLINGFSTGSVKIVYQAPTKSLCSERQRDWQAKFAPLDLQVAELTGDTDHAQMRHVQHASIIVTTPEKWDSMTRKWKDHQKLMQMVKLFLIDEVHILKEDRGATLEAVVSRMKSIGSDVRFVALSATVPNSQDIATWLGKDSNNPGIPAARERFGEEFRPVRLQKHVCGYASNSNDFAFDKTLNSKLTDIIAQWSHRKPLMVFCFTRRSCVETAQLLANWWARKRPQERYWTGPRSRITLGDKDLQHTVPAGVAFHHAGVTAQDRTAIEQAYLQGEINVICCTSTLAVGVNLPCHMVIIKNTVAYSATGSIKEYSDLEVMQMLGRAGRPQFDDSAVAVIMTRLQRMQFYETMISGQELLESCLHLNLIDHLNAEIGLGTVTNASSAKRWLSGTFLYVRLKDNPEHYKLGADADGCNLDERLENICRKAINMLVHHDLVRGSINLECTEFGDAMARYYLQFDTMKHFLALPPKAKISEILSAICKASEFKEVRFRAGEKPIYRELNKNNSIKFPIPVNIDSPAHKISLVIQSRLGAIELPTEDRKHQIEYATGKAIIFQHIHRLIRCIIDCQLYLEDAISARNALMLARSFGAQVWDDSPLHIKQLEAIGLVLVRKLVARDIKSIEDLEHTEPHRIEAAVGRYPPFGAQTQQRAKAFPRLRIAMKVVGEPSVKKAQGVTVKINAELGFMNEKVPESFNRRPVYVCLVVDTSEGDLVHFARISAKRLNKGQEIVFSAVLTAPSQTVRGSIMCDDIAGTQRTATLKPEIPAFMFPTSKSAEDLDKQRAAHVNAPNASRRRAEAAKQPRAQDDDEFGDADIDDADLAAAENDGFTNIDDYDDSVEEGSKTTKNKSDRPAPTTTEHPEPVQLPNGKWACNHRCQDKTACKHLCCREGLDKQPKPPKARLPKKSEKGAPKQTQLDLMKSQPGTNQQDSASEALSTTSTVSSRKPLESHEARILSRLHGSVPSSKPKVNILMSTPAGKLNRSVEKPSRHGVLASKAPSNDDIVSTSDYGLDTLDPADYANSTQPATHMSPSVDLGCSRDDDDMLDIPGADVLDDTPSYGKGDGHVDLPSWSNRMEPVKIADDTNLSSNHATSDEVHTSKPKQRGIFVTDISSSSDPNPLAMHDLDSLTDGSISAKHHLADDANEPAGESQSTKKHKSKSASNIGMEQDTQMHADVNSALNATKTTAAPSALVSAQTEEDRLREWWLETFGEDGINLV